MILLGKGAALKHLDRHRVYIYDLHDDPEGEVIKGGRGGEEGEERNEKERGLKGERDVGKGIRGERRGLKEENGIGEGKWNGKREESEMKKEDGRERGKGKRVHRKCGR